MNDPKFAIPDRVAFDANGYGWRVFDDVAIDGEVVWSMVPSNPDNEPIPEPITFFVRDELLREALNENNQEKQMLMVQVEAQEAELADLREWADRAERIAHIEGLFQGGSRGPSEVHFIGWIKESLAEIDGTNDTIERQEAELAALRTAAQRIHSLGANRTCTCDVVPTSNPRRHAENCAFRELDRLLGDLPEDGQP